MSELDDKIVEEFLVDSLEGLDQLDRDLVELEQHPDARETLGRVFRVIHTIKGTCSFLGFARLEHVAHAGESLLSRVRAGELAVTPEIVSALLSLNDALRRILTHIEAHRREDEHDDGVLVDRLERLRTNGEVPPGRSPAESPAAAPARGMEPAPEESSRPRLFDALIEAGRLDPEQVAIAEQQQRLGDPRLIGEILVDNGALTPDDVRDALMHQAQHHASGSAHASVRVDVQLLDQLMTHVGELVLARNQLLQVVTQQDHAAMPASAQRLNLVTTRLQEEILRTRMQPIANLWTRLPRLTRDVATACGKDVVLEMEGIDTELDKTLVEALKDPLTHLVRNAVDHGIESREERLLRGKPAHGTLRLCARHEGGQVHLEIADDGAGFAIERIRHKALERALVTPGRAATMTDHEWMQLVFMPGFSTAERVTSISGRGVGLDVVRNNLERIGGTIELHSRAGEGSAVRIRIPLTLAIIPALIVANRGERYAIPQGHLREMIRLAADSDAIEQVLGAAVLRLRGALLPLVSLSRQLGLESDAPVRGAVRHVVVLEAEGCTFGLLLDEVHDTEEIVVKPLDDRLRGRSAWAGATVLGDGRVALILDIAGLARRAGIDGERAARAGTPAAPEAEDGPRPERLLVLRLADGRSVAAPFGGIQRLEELCAADIERLGDRRVTAYRGGLLTLVALEEVLGASCPWTGHAGARIPVAVLEDTHGTVGLLVSGIDDIVEAPVHRAPADRRPGIDGCARIQDRVTEVLDLAAIVALAGASADAVVGGRA